MEQSTPSDDQQPTLKRRAILGSLWTIAGHGSTQVLRLIGNLFLTRLLFPEAFGLMALVQTFLVGLGMFSDIGIVPNIIHSEHGDEPKFLNTAWTVQVVRGFVLAAIAALIAVPVAQFYREPLLAQLLPVTGLTVLISGFASTKLATANRRLDLKRVTLLELGSYITGLIAMIIGAWLYRSVWALVAGGVISALVRTIASHLLLEGERNAFCWEKEALAQLKQFGQWIFLSTVIGFFAVQGDRLLLGRLLDVRFLGIYTVALGLSAAADQIIDQVGNRVLFPSYAELVRDRPERLYKALRKSRLILIGISVVCALVLVFLGKQLIDWLYDDRYIEAGWMLQVLAIGLLARTLSVTYGDVLMAKGKTFTMAVLLVISTAIQFTAMILGFQWAGYHGLIIGIAATQWLTYLVDIFCYSQLGLWQPELDLPIAVLASSLVAFLYFS